MIHLKKYFILFTCLFMASSIPVLNGSYAFFELNEGFKNDFRMAISLLFKNSADVILYGIDTNQYQIIVKPTNNFLITKSVEINFNGIILHKNVTEIQRYSIFELILLFEFKDNNLIFEKNVYQNIFIGNRLNLGIFEGLPIPVNLLSQTSKMFLWFGNTGPYKGIKDYSPFPIQMIGCINHVFINYIVINKTKIVGEDVSPSCGKQFQETVCEQNKCHNKIVEEHYFDCLGYSTQRFCYQDLVPFSEDLVSYQCISQVHERISIKLAWEEETSKRVCLIEVVFKNKLKWLFYINELHEIVLTENAEQNITDKILGKVPQKQINVIVINFRLLDLHVTISTGNAINTTIVKSLGYPQQINIGISFKSDSCVKFEGKTAFRYDSSQFKPKPKADFSLPFWITPLVAISIGFILMAFAIVCVLKRIRTKFEDEKEIVNHYEMEKSPLPLIPNEKESTYDIYEEVK